MTRDDPAAFAPPPAFGPFRVLHQIGIGALGPVFRTYEPTRDRLVAVKVFRLDITPEQSQALADELAAAADAGLFHPSIVEPIAAGVEGTVAYRAEEYVAGESMDVAIRHYAPAPLDKALPFITQLAGAIDFARAAGVGHGALHLRDIFVTPDEARASGFGVVDALERLGLRAPVRRPYSAPERIAGSSWGTPADVFSLAAITYELLTGRRPSGTGDQIGALAAEGIGQHAAAIRAVLARAMEDDPARRYQTALAFASALEAAASGGQVTDAIRDVSAIAAVAAAPQDERASRAIDPERPEPVGFEPIAVTGQLADEVLPPTAGLDPSEKDWPDLTRETALEAEQQFEDISLGDFEAERDEDEAHYDLLQRETADHPTDLGGFEDEATEDEAIEDLAIETAPTARFAEEFGRTLQDEQSDLLADSAHDHPSYHPAPGIAVPRREVVEPVEPARCEPVEPARRELVEPARREPVEPAGRELVEPARREPVEPARRADYEMRDAPLGGVVTERADTLPRAMILILGLLIGFAAGYAVRGRDATAPPPAAQAEPAASAPAPGAAPRGQEFSEETVKPPAPTPPGQAPPVPGDAPSAAASPSAAAPSQPAATAPAATVGSLVIRSTPTRAGVTVNGRWQGRTPLTLERLKFGPYTIRVVEPGYTVAREDLTLSAKDASRTLSFRLQRSGASAPTRSEAPAAPAATPPASPERGATYSGAIYVDSRPRGAAILIDGKRVGTTPARIPDMAIGSHVVRLELADHRPWTSSTRVAAGEETRVTGSLERIR